MDHLAIVNAIQTQDVPAFLAALEGLYGQKWVQKNFAFMGILCEEGAAGMFRTMGNGSNANLLKIAHAVIRSLAAMTKELYPHMDELDAIRGVMNTLWMHISSDFHREGVPETIFKGVVENLHEKREQQQNPSPPLSDVSPS